MMRARPWVLLVGIAALVALASPALAQAPGTVTLHIRADAGPATLDPGPLAVPDPILPNPLYDALHAAEGADAHSASPVPAPVAVEDGPDGLYIVPENGHGPIELVGWSPGLGQRTVAPVEFLADQLNYAGKLPVGVESSATYGPGSPIAQGRIGTKVPVEPPATHVAGVRAEVLPPVDDARPLAAPGALLSSSPAPYQAPLATAREAPVSSASAFATPSDSEGNAPLAAALAAAAGLLLLKVLLPLYHRFKRKTALDNGTRKGIYELLRAAPGSSAADLSEASHLHVTTVKYHLDVLRKVGMVGEEVVDGCRRFFSYENGDRAEFLTRALLDEPAAKAVYHQIETHPGLPFIEVARSLGMRKEHVHYHVKKLARHGLISDKWEGGRRLLFPAVQVPAHAQPVPAEVRA